MSRQPPERNLAPLVQRLRFRYAKRGRLRFSSHRDFQRALERAVRRAGVPMAYSAGFSPHPKISYANAVPTGVASEAEYVELGVTQPCDPVALCQALDEALPPGLDVLEVVVARTPDFVARLEASQWEFVLRGVSTERAAAALEMFLAADDVTVERLTKAGPRAVDVRTPVTFARVLPDDGSALVLPDDGSALVLPDDAGRMPQTAGPMSAVAQQPCAILGLVVRHDTPSVRPDDVLAALRRVADLAPPVPASVTRLAQGPLAADASTVGDPLAADREAAVDA